MQDFLRDSEDHDLGPALSHFLNCLFGNCQAISGKGVANSTHSRTLKKVKKFFSGSSNFLVKVFLALTSNVIISKLEMLIMMLKCYMFCTAKEFFHLVHIADIRYMSS